MKDRELKNSRLDRQPTLDSEIIKIRPLLPNDYDQLFSVASDPLIWEQHPVTDRYEEKVFLSFFNEAIQSGGALIVIDKQTHEIIGSSRFHGYNQKKSEVEIGWTFLSRSHWGGLYNKEVKHLMLKHAYKFVQNIIFVVASKNTRSQRAVEKIGGKRIQGRSERAGKSNYVYQLTKIAFEQNRRRKAPQVHAA